MEFQSYLVVLWRRKWSVILTTLLITAAAAAYSRLATPIYVSSTTLRVATVGSSMIGITYPDINLSDRLMNTYAQIVTGDNVVSEVVRQLNLSEYPALDVELIPGTELMRIKAEATDPRMAQQVAALTAEVLITQSRSNASNGQATSNLLQRQLEQIERELEEARIQFDTLPGTIEDNEAKAGARQSIQLKEQSYATLLDQYERVRLNESLIANAVTVIEPAFLPGAPAKPRLEVNLALGVVMGLLAGFVLAFVFDNIDTKLYTSSQIESVSKLPTLGRIPVMNMKKGSNYGIHVGQNGYLSQTEAFRRLRINLLASFKDEPQAILITSAETGEGKSTIAANLAAVVGRTGLRVVVVDCDLHHPTQHQIFGLPNDLGLFNVLTKQVGVEGVIQQSRIQNVSVVTSGPALSNLDELQEFRQLTPKGMVERIDQGTELLGTVEMRNVMAQLKQKFDVIMLDTPAYMMVTDAATLAPIVDEIALVVTRQRSHRNTFQAIQNQLVSLKGDAVGIVINHAEQDGRPKSNRVNGARYRN
jgi:non-specific protein-tyrosine kinase